MRRAPRFVVLPLIAAGLCARPLPAQGCLPRDSLGNPIPDTIPTTPPIGYRQLRLYYGKGTLTQLTPGSSVPVFGDTVVNGCQTFSYRMQLHPTVAVLPDIFLVDSQPNLVPAALDTVELDKGRRIESHPPLLDTITGKPSGGVNETTYYYIRFAVYKGPDPTALTAQLWTFGDSATDPRDFTEVPYIDAPKTKVEYIFSVALLSFGQRGFYPGPFEHRYILDSTHTGPLQSTNRHTSVDLSPPLVRTLFWDPRYLGRGIHWFRPWQYRKDRSAPDTIETFEQALVYPHTDFSVLLPGSAPIAALAAENQRVDTVWQVIRDWDSTVFTGDSSARDYRHFVDPSQLYLWGFVFNPRSPYKPLNFGDTISGDRTGPPEFYLGPDRRFQWTRLLDTLHVSLIARDAYNLKDSVPILVRSRGLRISRLRFQTRDPSRRVRRRCYGVGCLDASPHGGFEGAFPPRTVDVVYDTTGLSLEVLAGGFRDDLATMDTMSWRITPQFWRRIEGHGRNPTLRSDAASAWPDFNYSWGPTVLFASVTLDTFRLVEAAGVQLYFPRDARVQPDGGGDHPAPNWFRYWLQVIRQAPGFTELAGTPTSFFERQPTDTWTGSYAPNATGSAGTLQLNGLNEMQVNFVTGQITTTPHLFRHTRGCDHASVSAHNWTFPTTPADDDQLATAAGLPAGFATMPAGYCRLQGVSSVSSGIDALALVWEHEAGHALYLQRLAAWAQANHCVGTGCEAVGATVAGQQVVVYMPSLYWTSSPVGHRFQCHGLVPAPGLLSVQVLLGPCADNVRHWMEFVADMHRYRITPDQLRSLHAQDWAYPGSQYAH